MWFLDTHLTLALLQTTLMLELRIAVQVLKKIASSLGLQEIRSMRGGELWFRNSVLRLDSAGTCDLGFFRCEFVK